MPASESPTKEGGYLLVMKGAPEKIWSLCSSITVDGKEELIDDEWNRRFIEAYELLGGMGERCLGCCQLWLSTRSFPIPTKFDAENPNFPLEDLTFLGLFSLIDPLRCTVPMPSSNVALQVQRLIRLKHNLFKIHNHLKTNRNISNESDMRDLRHQIYEEGKRTR